MSPRINQQVKVARLYAGQRLDAIASALFPDFSRSRLQTWIKAGSLLVDGVRRKPNVKLSGGETLSLDAELESSEEWVAEPVEFEVLHDDEHIIVVNKPQPLVVHPGAGNWRGTLLNGLLHRYPELARIPRAGIVHRLDKETSGLMVVARSLIAQMSLVEQLQARSVSRTYWAVVQGDIAASGSVETQIGRHPAYRTRMAVLKSGGKEAITHFTRLKRFNGFSLVELKLETGRTHQIRVHMAHLGHALVGDPVYGKPANDPGVSTLRRQALHAKALGLKHPLNNEALCWMTELPDDMRTLVNLLDVAK